MAEEKTNNEALATILQEHNGKIPKFLDEVLQFLDKETELGSYDKAKVKQLLSQAVDRQFKGLPADADIRKIFKKYNARLFDPKKNTTKFWTQRNVINRNLVIYSLARG